MVLRRADYLTRPWRNGGGVSHEIAWHPEEDWRLGLAEIVRDGPFSDYSGFDRTLTIAEGRGLWLNEHALDSTPFTFRGEEAIVARVTTGPLVVVNAITRRSRMGHEVRRLPALGPLDRADFAVALGGTVRLGGEALAPLDAFRLDGARVELGGDDGAEVLAIRFHAA